MRLSELLIYNSIVVQCHDNPDADALASGDGVYTYLTEQGNEEGAFVFKRVIWR